MKIEKTWGASSKLERFDKGKELIDMAGRWGIGIEVSITMPYTYSQGPVEKRIIGEETLDRENLPSPNTS